MWKWLGIPVACFLGENRSSITANMSILEFKGDYDGICFKKVINFCKVTALKSPVYTDVTHFI